MSLLADLRERQAELVVAQAELAEAKRNFAEQRDELATLEEALNVALDDPTAEDGVVMTALSRWANRGRGIGALEAQIAALDQAIARLLQQCSTLKFNIRRPA